ncbi:MAG: hypothetical protein MH252_07560 [Thermosynechococcaceae cyanobacterium MS004]|nr:hypothetical protein [Thermosynechococcaceae cyanobacterium MS004]
MSINACKKSIGFGLIASLFLVGCDGSIMDAKYIKSIQPLINSRYQVLGEANLLAKKMGNTLEQESQECWRNYNEVSTSVNTVIDEISLSVLAEADLPASAELSSQISEINSSRIKFLKCSRNFHPRQSDGSSGFVGVAPIDLTSLIGSILTTVTDLRAQRIGQQQKFVEEINKLKLPPFSDLLAVYKNKES